MPVEAKAKLKTTSENKDYTNCIFEESWWLDAVAPNEWDEIIIKNGERVTARLPYVLKKRFGKTFILMPQLTQCLGPWMESITGKYSNVASKRKELINKIIDRLPEYDLFRMELHYSLDNWLPFYWRGFTQTTYYTYVIEDLSDLDKVWNEFDSTVRNRIRKAQKLIHINNDPDIDRFLHINKLTFERQGLSLPYGEEFIRRLDSACSRKGARRIFFAEDDEGNTHSAIYIIWDEKSAYYLMGGIDPQHAASYANPLLFWEAIKFCSTVTKKFDFEGSMVEPIEKFMRGFGAVQKPYFEVMNTSSSMKLLMAGVDVLGGLRKVKKWVQG